MKPDHFQSDSQDEVSSMLKRMQEMKRDLEEKMNALNDAGQRANVNVSQLKNKSSLSAAQFEKYLQMEKELGKKIKEAIPPETCAKRIPKGTDKLTQERKGKMRGARNKWIPIK